MRFGVRLPNAGPFASAGALTQTTKEAERLGYDFVCVHDHVNWGETDKYHFYAGSVEAVDANPPAMDYYDTIATLGFLSAITTRIRLIPTAICLAWRHPLLLARQASTLHHLSAGRFTLCVTVGNVTRDFDVMNVPFEKRGEIAREHLKALLTALKTPGPVDFQGKYVRFAQAEIYPKADDLPIWYAGAAEVSLKRAAHYADGWLPSGSPEYYRKYVPRLRESLSEYGRNADEFAIGALCYTSIDQNSERAHSVAWPTIENRIGLPSYKRAGFDPREQVLVGSPEKIVSRLYEYAEAGVSHVGLGFIGHRLEDIFAQMRMFADEVVPRLSTGA